MQKKSGSKKSFKTVIVIVFLAIAAVVGVWLWLKNEIDHPFSHSAAQKSITIEPGASTSVILARLHREGILESELPAKLWLRLFEPGLSLKAGEYTFKSPISPRQVINQLRRGDRKSVV